MIALKNNSCLLGFFAEIVARRKIENFPGIFAIAYCINYAKCRAEVQFFNVKPKLVGCL